jgi:hypothetical protein
MNETESFAQRIRRIKDHTDLRVDEHARSALVVSDADWLIEMAEMLSAKLNSAMEYGFESEGRIKDLTKTNEDLVRLALWSARRLPKIHKEFVYNEIENTTRLKYERL